MVNVVRLTLRHFDPLAFFLKLGPAEVRPSYVVTGAWTVLAWNPDATLSTSADGAWARLEAFAAAAPHIESDLPFTGGVIGTVSYDAGLALHGLTSKHASSSVPYLHFHRYASALLWNGRELFVVGDTSFVGEVKKIHARPEVSPVVPSFALTPAMKRSQYDAAFRRVQRGILDGEYYQLNLTYQLVAEAPHDPRHLFAHLLTSHPAPSACYSEGEGFAVVSLSPESFISIRKGHIVTSPIKGTRPRGKNDKEDRAMSRALLASEKEAAELNMITDLLRNDLGQIARTGTVRVTGHRLLQENPTVWHTYSVIEAKIDPRFSPLDVLRNMFPGGSVTGCPKVAAMKEIDKLEVSSRGFYTGCSVMLSGDTLESSILIRTIVSEGKKLSLGIGGGIVADSVCADEYEETRRKAAPFLGLVHGDKKIFINGAPAAHDDPRIAFLDPAHEKARGVFETMVARDGKVEHLTAHLARLVRSAKIIGLKLPMPVKKIETLISAAASDDYGFPLRIKAVATMKDIVMSAEPLITDASHAHGVAVTFVRLDRRHPEAKALPYHREWMAHQSACKKGAAEALLVDRHGCVTEGAYSNVFWVKRGTLFTAKDGLLPGITRGRVLAVAKKLGIPVRFASVTADDLPLADEVFFTKSTTGVTPVHKIDRTLIGSGKTGVVTKKLMAEIQPTSSSFGLPLAVVHF